MFEPMSITVFASPCKDCSERCEGCHTEGNCRRFDTYKLKTDAYRRMRNRKSEIEADFYRAKCDFLRRIK